MFNVVFDITLVILMVIAAMYLLIDMTGRDDKARLLSMLNALLFAVLAAFNVVEVIEHYTGGELSAAFTLSQLGLTIALVVSLGVMTRYDSKQ